MWKLERPAWARRLALHGEAVGAAAALVSLDPAELIETAVRTTGLDDFGDDDWREPYRRLLGAIDREGRMHALGRLMTRTEVLRCLQTRLRLAEQRRRQPDVAEEAIASPIVISGPARSGTSILFELLWQDPRLRAPLAWEALHPVLERDAASGSADPRLRWAEAEQEFWADVQPELAALHELRSDLPVECITLSMPSFLSGHWSIIAEAPDWDRWRATQDASPDYAYHRRVLQSLQWQGRGRRWLLKSPFHLSQLPALFRAYPDAVLIHTHRDPLKTVPSTISIAATVRFLRSDAVDLSTLSQRIGLGFRFMLERVIDLRERGEIPRDQVLDLHYRELLREPVATLRALYAKLERVTGLAASSQLEERWRLYLEAKPQGRFGEHRYAPEDFGLDRSALAEHYLRYRQHYGIEAEEA